MPVPRGAAHEAKVAAKEALLGPPASYARCPAGSLRVDGLNETLVLVRNTGGGKAKCCSNHPIAAPVRVAEDGRSVEVYLEPRHTYPATAPTRNGAATG